MLWNISKVTNYNDSISVIGYSPDLNGRCLNCTITKTTLEAAMSKLGANDYNEGYGLSVVSCKVAYIIDIVFHTDKNYYEMMKMLPSTPVDKNIYLDGEYYMGLPAITYLLWKSMVTCDL